MVLHRYFEMEFSSEYEQIISMLDKFNLSHKNSNIYHAHYKEGLGNGNTYEEMRFVPLKYAEPWGFSNYEYHYGRRFEEIRKIRQKELIIPDEPK